MLIKTNCRICSSYCGVEVEVNGKEIVSIRGDKSSISKGFICKKGLSYIDKFKKGNIKFPMVRSEDGALKEVKWDQALDYIANKLKPIIEKKPESIVIHSGDSYYNNDFSDMAKVFLNAIGSPNFSDSGSYCNLARDLANILLHGNPAPKPDYENAETIVLWGSNPRSSHPRFARAMESNIEKGGKLVVIDPVENNLAKKADLYIQIRPGSDGALALGILNVLFKRNAIDQSYWEKNSIGFEEFKSYIEKFDLINTEIITWVEAEKIIKLADIYQESISLSSSIGVAIELQTNAVDSIRSIMALDILSGFLDSRGSNMILGNKKINAIEIISNKKAIGQSEFPLLRNFFGIAQVNRLSEYILNRSVSAAIIYNGNPALTLPNTNEVRKAFEKLDFLIYIGNQINETSEYADIILPMTNMYEIDSFIEFEDKNNLYIKLAKKAVEPEYNQNKFFIELAKRLGYFENMEIKSEEELFNFRTNSIDHDFKKNDLYLYGKYEENKPYSTKSKKIELSSPILKKYNYNPNIEFKEPQESMLTNPPNAEFIFTATTGTRAAGAEIMDDGRKIKIASADKAVLKKYHKHDGDMVRISSPRGSIDMIIRVSDRICPNTISIPQATAEQNPNILVDNKILDPIIGYPGCRSFLIKLED